MRPLALILALLPGPALAHDWYEGQRNPVTAELCCGRQDCGPIEARVVPGGYQLPSGDVVPEAEAMPSQDGQFHICVWGGQRRCFFAPQAGT